MDNNNLALRSADERARATRADIYLGVVAPTGVDRSSFINSLREAMEAHGYGLQVWRLSQLLEDFQGVALEDSSALAQIESAMAAGTRLRTEVAEDALARAAFRAIGLWRSQRSEEGSIDSPHAHLFWSLKHPAEVAALRHVYGLGFHLLGLHAEEEERTITLKGRGLSFDEARNLIARDRDEAGVDSGQKTRDTFHLSDAFLQWGHTPDREGLRRYVELIFGNPFHTPTADEHRMFLAYASSLRSGELSRQVGAVIANAHGDVIATGANDVPRFGGSLYWPGAKDDRDLARGFDSNTRHRSEILSRVASELGGGRELTEKLERSSLKDITEYGRAVHAEMDALMSAARSGVSTVGGTLHATTFPCHNCARHIIAAGITRVVFVEPYPKSRAVEFHKREVTLTSTSDHPSEGRVAFTPHVGVGPRRFFDYFSMTLGNGYALVRKKPDGTRAEVDAKAASPRGAALVSVVDLEASMVEELLPHLGQAE